MSGGRLTIWINNREALPVRAIPYVADWGNVSPEWLTDYLEKGEMVARGAVPLTAYHYVNDEFVAVLPREWKIVAARVNGIVNTLHEQRPHLSPISDHAGYAAYQEGAIDALPRGVFVWLDEFKTVYQTHCKRNHYGSDTLTLYPVAAQDKATRERLLEGFACITPSPQPITLDNSGNGVVSRNELDAWSQTKGWQFIKESDANAGSKKTAPPAAFVSALETLLKKIEAAAKSADKSFDRNLMPGVEKNLFEFARQQRSFPGVTIGTFKAYRKRSGLCSFEGNKSSDFYEKLIDQETT